MAFVDQLIRRENVVSKQESAQEPSGGSDIEGTQESGGVNPNHGAPFMVALNAFLSPHPRQLTRSPPHPHGRSQLGGPIMTAGGVAFLTSTLDQYVRAYDVTSGLQLWEDRLPAGGQATPMTYRSEQSGRQFVVVVAGGHGSLGTRAGDSIIAYALPR